MFKMGCMARKILAPGSSANNENSRDSAAQAQAAQQQQASNKKNRKDKATQQQQSSGNKQQPAALKSSEELGDFSKLEDDPRLPLNKRQIFKITKSWKAIARTMSKTGTAMFLNLFEQNKDLFYLFDRFQHLKGKELHESMELREHAATVMSTLDQSINSLSDYDNFVTYLHSIGQLHRKVPGFKREYFWKIEQPFMKAVKQTLDERCNEMIEEIYKIAIKLIIETIADGYGNDSTPSGGSFGAGPAAKLGGPERDNDGGSGGGQSGAGGSSSSGAGQSAAPGGQTRPSNKAAPDQAQPNKPRNGTANNDDEGAEYGQPTDWPSSGAYGARRTTTTTTTTTTTSAAAMLLCSLVSHKHDQAANGDGNKITPCQCGACLVAVGCNLQSKYDDGQGMTNDEPNAARDVAKAANTGVDLSCNVACQCGAAAAACAGPRACHRRDVSASARRDKVVVVGPQQQQQSPKAGRQISMDKQARLLLEKLLLLMLSTCQEQLAPPTTAAATAAAKTSDDARELLGQAKCPSTQTAPPNCSTDGLHHNEDDDDKDGRNHGGATSAPARDQLARVLGPLFALQRNCFDANHLTMKMAQLDSRSPLSGQGAQEAPTMPLA